MITLLIKKTTGYKQGYKLLTYFRDDEYRNGTYIKGDKYLNTSIDIDGTDVSYVIPGDNQL